MKKDILLIGLLFSIFTGCATKQEQTPSLKKVPIQDKVIEMDSLYEKERKDLMSNTMDSPKIQDKCPDKIYALQKSRASQQKVLVKNAEKKASCAKCNKRNNLLIFFLTFIFKLN